MSWTEMYGESKRGVQQSIGQLSDTALRLKELREKRKQEKTQNLMNLGQMGMQGIGLASQLKTGKQARDIAGAAEDRAQGLYGPALEAAKMEPDKIQAQIDHEVASTNKMTKDIEWLDMQMKDYPATVEHQREMEELQLGIGQQNARVAEMNAELKQMEMDLAPEQMVLEREKISAELARISADREEMQIRLEIAKLQLAGLSKEQAQAILPALSQARDLWLQSRPQYLDVNGMPDPSKWYTDAGKQDFRKFLVESGEAQNLGIDPAQQDTILDAFWGGETVAKAKTPGPAGREYPTGTPRADIRFELTPEQRGSKKQLADQIRNIESTLQSAMTSATTEEQKYKIENLRRWLMSQKEAGRANWEMKDEQSLGNILSKLQSALQEIGVSSTRLQPMEHPH